jgi:hypothetical protein
LLDHLFCTVITDRGQSCVQVNWTPKNEFDILLEDLRLVPERPPSISLTVWSTKLTVTVDHEKELSVKVLVDESVEIKYVKHE